MMMIWTLYIFGSTLNLFLATDVTIHIYYIELSSQLSVWNNFTVKFCRFAPKLF